MEKIYLTAVMDDDGIMSVVDQDGRQVDGLQAVSAHHDVDDVVSMSLRVIDMRGGKPRASGRPAKQDASCQ